MGNMLHWPKAAGPLPPDFVQDNLTDVPFDENAVAICVGILIALVSFVAIVPTFKLSERSLFSFVGAFLSLFVLTGILLGIYGFNWMEDKVVTRTQYKAATGERITAEIGLKIGLGGVNITLEGLPHQQLNETINYNEHFSWEWHQHREGFSKFAGKINQELRRAQEEGLPYPILWVAEYFTLDGENVLWGRYYRSAGFYVDRILWFAFRCWVMAMILTCLNLKYAGYFFIMTSSFILLCNIVYATVTATPPIPFVIPFEDGHLNPSFGWTFYMNLTCGLVSFLLGVLILFYSKRDLKADRTEWVVRANLQAVRDALGENRSKKMARELNA